MAIFPVTTQEDIQDAVITDRGIDFLYDFRINDFILKDGKFIELTGDAAVVFWIEKCLRTEFEKSAVYKYTGFGTKLETYRGKVFPRQVASSLLETSIREALLKHERINAIENFEFNQVNEEVTISFEVDLNPLTQVTAGILFSDEGFTKLNTLDDIKKFLGIKLITSNRFLFKTNLGAQVYLNL